MKHWTKPGLIVVCLLMAACAPQTQKPTTPGIVKGKIDAPEIRLQVKNGQLVVKNLDTPNCKGQGGGEKGCIVTGVEDISFVRLVLQGSGQYQLTNFWICAGGSKPALTDPGDPRSFDCELLGDRNSEFLVIIGGSVTKASPDGRVDLGGVREFYVLNQNTFQSDYFYLVEACKGQNDCSILDPRIRNGGRKVIR